MKLASLFPDADLVAGAGACEVQGLASDSRKVAPGAVFFAMPGTKAHGLGYVADAVAQGAIAIVAEEAPPGDIGAAAFVQVADVRAALAHASARLHPRQPGTIVAVTGTSGKTSIAAFVRQIWTRLGHQAASIGTLGVMAPSGEIYGSLTTPDPVALHQSMARLAAEGVTHLVMEASSHGLDQRRLDGVRLAAAAFTNLSRDHLDYHSGFADYLAAKLRLFEVLLQPGQTAVVDADSDAADQVIAACRQRGLKLLTTGVKGQDLQIIEIRPENFATRLALAHQGREYRIRLPLAGLFQASNALVAAGLCIATGSEAAMVIAALEHLVGAPGRLEHVGSHERGQIFIDYAHKPDALAKGLQALRPFVRKSLIVVFGCGGDRDPGKRPMMGEIAAQFADVVIVTDDNPRSEDPASIRRSILAKAPRALDIGDRAQAIARAIRMLSEDDLLLIAGKGHETGQIVGDQILPFSDHDVVAHVLKDLQK